LASNEAPWLFVFFHVGLFTSRGEGYLETGMRERLAPLFEQYNVDAVFMGHHHSYERVIVNGITYIITAGGGASLYELEKMTGFLAGRLTVAAGSLTVLSCLLALNLKVMHPVLRVRLYNN